jgi:hypothetical protein
MKHLPLAALLSLMVATPALAGSPALRVTLPADHTDGLRRGGFLVVHGHRHGDRFPLALTGFAEGIVNGERRRVPLTFVRDTLDGSLMVVTNTWGGGGPWVLNIGGGFDSTEVVTGIVVGVNPQGVPTLVQIPRNAIGVPRMATRGEVTQLLAHLAGQRAEAPAMTHGAWRIVFLPQGMVLLLLAALPVLYLIYVRQRRGREVVAA